MLKTWFICFELGAKCNFIAEFLLLSSKLLLLALILDLNDWRMRALWYRSKCLFKWFTRILYADEKRWCGYCLNGSFNCGCCVIWCLNVSSILLPELWLLRVFLFDMILETNAAPATELVLAKRSIKIELKCFFIFQESTVNKR